MKRLTKAKGATSHLNLIYSISRAKIIETVKFKLLRREQNLIGKQTKYYESQHEKVNQIIM